jgi:hypothetical protein
MEYMHIRLSWPVHSIQDPLFNTILVLPLLSSIWPSVAVAIADVFRDNGISVGMNLAKILKILEKIDEAKSQGLFKGPS